MSSVISTAVTADVSFPDGTRLVRYSIVLEDNNSIQETVEYVPGRVPADFDANAQAVIYGDKALIGKKRSEELSIADVDAVASPLEYIQSPRWSTSKLIAKVAIYWMWQSKDPRAVIYLKPLILFLQDPNNYTPQQLANFLDITIPQLQKLNQYVNGVLEDPASAKSMETLISEMDANAEVIE